MKPGFISDLILTTTSWQGFERIVMRLLLHEGFEHLQLVGGSGDEGADVIASKGTKRWLFQVKRWAGQVGPSVVARTIHACATYGADIPVIVSRTGFSPATYEQQVKIAREGLPIQLWDRSRLLRAAERLEDEAVAAVDESRFGLRLYQETAVAKVMSKWLENRDDSALVVLATGLGKTRVAAEYFRRLVGNRPNARLLVLAHRNEIVYQLERAFWPYLKPSQATAVWNGYEKPDPDLMHSTAALFACVDSVFAAERGGETLPTVDVVLVDECHHLGTDMYESVLDSLQAGRSGGPFLLGLTATPWRPGGVGLDHRFDRAAISIDLVEGLRQGFLANVDYRMYTDNVDWKGLQNMKGELLTPRAINRTLFIDEWDDAVVNRMGDAWNELDRPKAIVFCGTIAHAERMTARINSLGFTRAASIYSRSSRGEPMGVAERGRIIWDFSEGRIGALCAVDVLNEGVDVPDVNLVVFQRVTHSRRIFVQQLGRGLRLSPGKDKVVVLDFVSDVRRFAAGIELQDSIGGAGRKSGTSVVRLGSKVRFMRANAEDVSAESFLREWLSDLEQIQDAGDDASVLRFPPEELVPGGRI